MSGALYLESALDQHDYKDYGAFKMASSGGDSKFKSRLGRLFGIKSRYLRFFKRFSRQERVVEIGCGSGAFLQLLREEKFLDVVGVEPSPSYIKETDCPVHLCRADEYLIECPDQSIGLIVMLDVMEHIPISELPRLLDLMKRKLKIGGSIVIRVPNMASPLAMTNFYGDTTHVTPLNLNSIKQLCFSAQLDVISFHSEPYAFPRSLIDVIGCAAYICYRAWHLLVLRAFGIRGVVSTPNIVVLIARRS